MKKVFKTIVISLFVISNIVLASGIYLTYRQHQEHQKMVKIATSKEAKEIYEKHMKTEDPDALTPEGKIISYKINTETIQAHPMGGEMVEVFVNDNQDLLFQFHILGEANNLHSGPYVLRAKLVKFLKEGE